MSRRPAGISAGLLLCLTAGAFAQPVFVEGPAGVANGNVGRIVIAAPGAAMLGAPTGGNAVFRGMGFGSRAGNVQFGAKSFGSQVMRQTRPQVLGQVGATGEVASIEEAPSAPKITVTPYADYSAANGMVMPQMKGFTGITAASLGNLSPESAQQDAGKQFDFNLYAKKGVKVQAPVAPAPKAETHNKTVNPTGKTETSKSHLPIHRPEESQSSFEPGLYSPSRLGEFDWNKDDYILHWVFRVKNDKPKVVEAFMGGIAHQAMEQVSVWLAGGKRAEDFTLEDVLEVYNTLWEEQYVEGKYKLDKGFTLEDYRRRGEDFVKSMWARHYPFNKGKTIFFERKMMFYVEEAGTGKRYRFQGIPDMVKLFEDENMIEISDWKTTVFEKTPEMLKQHDMQLALYVLAIRQNFPDLAKGKSFRLKWNFKNTVAIVNVDDAYLAEVVDRVATRIHEMEVAEAQAEANRAEWERRINPVKAPKGMADATKLVDRWTKIHWKQETLSKELKKLEEEEEALIARLLDFAKKTGNTTIPGRVKDAVLGEKENVKVPTKSADKENYEKLARLIKEAGLWEEFSALDLGEIKNMAKLAGHPHHALYEKIKELVTIGMKQDMKLKDHSEEPKKKKK